MEVLNHHHRGSISDELGEQVTPSDSKPLYGRQRMQVAGDVESEGQSEDPAGAQPFDDLLARVTLAHAQQLAEHVPERPVGERMAVRQAAATQRARLGGAGLRRQPCSELLCKPRFADSRITDDRDQARTSVNADVTVFGEDRVQFCSTSDKRCE